ncbi:hypothetical protein JX265_003718 [Neoarthrinium moseri]|uniref:Peptidase S8/S53 domain-containing protein n=1 Tax=Neoarthrinium moseri TaxID=1658444 RepID=A0A9P9WSD5_9PEZI|nr:hypothetical protein JX266_001100 [Neoarthrinium moseri]KAI1877710.1 hypothetical protein JX265_003718 [Neoarthrinium moseri]
MALVHPSHPSYFRRGTRSLQQVGLGSDITEPEANKASLESYSKEKDSIKVKAHFKHRPITHRGGEATIFVLDTGFDADAEEQYQKHVRVINTLAVMKACGSEPTDLELVKACKDDSKYGLDMDMDHFHGTNVTQYAASKLYGSASAAQVVNITAAKTGAEVHEKLQEANVTLAFSIILALHKNGEYNLEKSVINCSWGIGLRATEALHLSSGTAQLLRSIIYHGGNIVGASGNDNVSPDTVSWPIP